MGSTESIEMLLTAVQISVEEVFSVICANDRQSLGATTIIDSKKKNQHHQTSTEKVQSSYFGCMQRLSVVLH
jgi:hypothetical protein